MHSVTLPQAVRMVSGKIESEAGAINSDPANTDNTTIGVANPTAEERQ
jgi:hypothetical protein